jgi:hypothetical protein
MLAMRHLLMRNVVFISQKVIFFVKDPVNSLRNPWDLRG